MRRRRTRRQSHETRRLELGLLPLTNGVAGPGDPRARAEPQHATPVRVPGGPEGADADGQLGLVAVGVDEKPTAATLRDAAAAFTRAAGKRAHLATNLAAVDGVDAASAARAVTEGVLLADYRYVGQKSDKSGASKLETLSLVVGQSDERAATRGIARGVVTSDAANLARELANTPANLLTASVFAARAVGLAGERGLAGGEHP